MCKFFLNNLFTVMVIDNLLHCHVELPHVLDLAVHLINFFGWMGQGTLLQSALFYQNTPSQLKVIGGGGDPYDSSVSPSPLGFDF